MYKRQAWILAQPPASLGVHKKHVRLWFPETPPQEDSPDRARYLLAQEALRDAAAQLQPLTDSHCAALKADALARFGTTLLGAIAALNGGEGDPDFLLYLRAYGLASLRIPNLSSLYYFLTDVILDGQDPASGDFDTATAYTLFQLQQTIETIRAMRDTTSYFVTQVEARFRGTMAKASPQSIELLSLILARLAAKDPDLAFPSFGPYVQELAWFAEDWDIQIIQDVRTAKVIIPSIEDFPLKPHICEAISLKLAEYQH